MNYYLVLWVTLSVLKILIYWLILFNIVGLPSVFPDRKFSRATVGELNVDVVSLFLGLMLVRKVSTQISLCSPHILIRDDTFSFKGEMLIL